MPEPDTLPALIAELGALPKGQRGAILRSLSAAERSRVTALLGASEARRDGDGARQPAVRLSPWLEARLKTAETDASDSRITAASRRALAEATREAHAEDGPTVSDAAAGAKGRSLMDAIGELFAGRRLAR